MGSLELVALSPMTRALQTATLAFPNASARPPFVATSLARERVWLHACDGRRPRSELQRDFAHLDFGAVTSEVDKMFELKENEPSDRNSTRCAERATRLLQWLHARPEQGIAVVSHWVFTSSSRLRTLSFGSCLATPRRGSSRSLCLASHMAVRHIRWERSARMGATSSKVLTLEPLGTMLYAVL